jgi:HAD superfamily hydrolase (TIGR01459 family)
MTIKILPGIAAIAEAYDGFVLDLWGVVHDGRKPYPDAIDCLTRLHGARQGDTKNKRIVMLSNAPRRSSGVIEGMTAMDIDRALYDDVVTSGELTWQALKTRGDSWHRALGRRCLHVGPERDHGLFDGLDLTLVDKAEGAEFIVNTGPWRDEETLEDYVPLLQAAAARKLPMICANPDLEVIRGGVRIICAGTLAAYYESLGAPVRYHGKPHAAAYDACLAAMGLTDRTRIVAVGDSLIPDIKGGVAAGVATLLVTSGIHAEELGLAYGDHPDPIRLEAASGRLGIRPQAAVAAFRW